MTVDFTEMEMADYDERQAMLNETEISLTDTSADWTKITSIEDASHKLQSIAEALEKRTFRGSDAEDAEELIELLFYCAETTPMSEFSVSLTEQAQEFMR